MAPIPDSTGDHIVPLDSVGDHHLFHHGNVHVHKPPHPDSPELARRKMASANNGGRGFSAAANRAEVMVEVPLDMQRRIDYFARLVVPFVILIFNVYYWGSAIQAGGIEL